MKKIKLMLILIMCIFVSNLKVYAASATLSVSSQNVSVGDKFIVYVKVNSAAAWNIQAIASGVVGKCELKQADTTADALDTTKTFSTTCTAFEEGTINISLSGDVTSASDGVAVNVSDNKAIKVNKKVVNNNTNNTNNTNNKVNKKSDNNKLKELSVENYEIKKIDDNNYELVVNKEVNSINVKAIPEDSKAKINGVGVYELSLGENKVELVITSESGKENKINLKIIRREFYYLSDLSSLLNDFQIEVIDVAISNNDKLSSDIIDNIKKSKKIVNLNYYDEDNKLLYAWELDGNKIGDISELELNVSFETDNIDNILELSNYADGMVVNIPDNNNLSTGVRFKLYVGDRYKNNKKLNVYRYIKSDNKLSLIGDNLIVNDGYIKFDVNDNNDYFITMFNDNKKDDNKFDNSILFIIISIIELIVILLLIFMIFRWKKNNISSDKKKNNDIIKSQNSNINNISNSVLDDNINNNMNNEFDFFNNIMNNNNDSNLNNITNIPTNNINTNSNNFVGIHNSMVNNNINSGLFNNVSDSSDNIVGIRNGNVNTVSNNNLNVNSNSVVNNQNNNIYGNIPNNNINSDVYNNQNGNINNNMF